MIYPRRFITLTALDFVGTYQFWALVCRCFPWLADNWISFTATQTRNLSVYCTPCMFLSAQGVCAGLLQGLTPRSLHYHWPIGVNWLLLLLLILFKYLEEWVSVSLQGLPWRFLLSLPWCLALLLNTLKI